MTTHCSSRSLTRRTLVGLAIFVGSIQGFTIPTSVHKSVISYNTRSTAFTSLFLSGFQSSDSENQRNSHTSQDSNSHKHANSNNNNNNNNQHSSYGLRNGTSTTLYSGSLLVEPETSTDQSDAIPEAEDSLTQSLHPKGSWIEDNLLSTFWGPRAILLILALVYATNFPLGALLNANLPASAATSSRMLLAALALCPFIFKLAPNLRWQAVLCGCFTSLGYISQSLALVDLDPAKVSFLGSATVLWCPLLEAFVEKKPMGLSQAPQTWLAAIVCLAGVALLELVQPGGTIAWSSVGWSDGLALLQAVGFGTGVFWTSQMIRKDTSQALPVTATLIATTALVSVGWCWASPWIHADNWYDYTLPGVFMNPDLRTVALALLWTGIVSTSLNFFIELTALGRIAPSEASIWLATEPLWAAILAAAFYQGHLGLNDYLGGGLLILSCMMNGFLKPHNFEFLFGKASGSNNDAN